MKMLAAVATIFVVTSCGGDGDTPLRDQPGYEEARNGAEIYCTLAGVVGPNGPDSLYDPEYLACVREETRAEMEKNND